MAERHIKLLQQYQAKYDEFKIIHSSESKKVDHSELHRIDQLRKKEDLEEDILNRL